MKRTNNKVLAGFLITTQGMISKLTGLVSIAWGWCLMTLGTILNFFIPVREMFHVLFLLLIFDAIFGLMASKKNKQAFTSDRMRSSFYKLLVYLVVLCLVFIVEKVLAFDLTIRILFGVAYAIELVSISANLLILRPNMPFLKLVSGALVGEIASKMSMSKDEVEDKLGLKKEDKKND